MRTFLTLQVFCLVCTAAWAQYPQQVPQVGYTQPPANTGYYPDNQLSNGYGLQYPQNSINPSQIPIGYQAVPVQIIPNPYASGQGGGFQSGGIIQPGQIQGGIYQPGGQFGIIQPGQAQGGIYQPGGQFGIIQPGQVQGGIYQPGGQFGIVQPGQSFQGQNNAGGYVLVPLPNQGSVGSTIQPGYPNQYPGAPLPPNIARILELLQKQPDKFQASSFLESIKNIPGDFIKKICDTLKNLMNKGKKDEDIQKEILLLLTPYTQPYNQPPYAYNYNSRPNLYK